MTEDTNAEISSIEDITEEQENIIRGQFATNMADDIVEAAKEAFIIPSVAYINALAEDVLPHRPAHERQQWKSDLSLRFKGLGQYLQDDRLGDIDYTDERIVDWDKDDGARFAAKKIGFMWSIVSKRKWRK
jgi:hypothetical protein